MSNIKDFQKVIAFSYLKKSIKTMVEEDIYHTYLPNTE